MTVIATGIYTLTPTHIGAGQSTGAIDLPIAREALTGLPLLPSSALKGVARDLFEGAPGSSADVVRLFGSAPPGSAEAKRRAKEEREEKKNSEDDTSKGADSSERQTSTSTSPGALIFHDGLLAAYPFRALHSPFVHATCPLLLERLERLSRALQLDIFNLPMAPELTVASEKALEGGNRPRTAALEDVVVKLGSVHGTTKRWAEALASLLPPSEKDSVTGNRLREGLVVLPDDTFLHLIRTAPPVQARVQLTSGKTTDKFTTQDGHTESGNLWYEETLPSDALFVSMITERRVFTARSAAPSNAVRLFEVKLAEKGSVQIGGNETLGGGLCWWTGRQV
jgi:CRISPR-associated protein Cmr4